MLIHVVLLKEKGNALLFACQKLLPYIYGVGDFNHYQKGAAQNFHFPRTGLCQGDEHTNCYVASFFVIKRFGFLSSSS